MPEQELIIKHLLSLLSWTDSNWKRLIEMDEEVAVWFQECVDTGKETWAVNHMIEAEESTRIVLQELIKQRRNAITGKKNN